MKKHKNMINKYKVNKEKCIGCGTCVAICPEGMKLEEDGKAKVINLEELEKCGGKDICPMAAIEKNGSK